MNDEIIIQKVLKNLNINPKTFFLRSTSSLIKDSLRKKTNEAYVTDKKLLMDKSDKPIKHTLIEEIFSGKKGYTYIKLKISRAFFS